MSKKKKKGGPVSITLSFPIVTSSVHERDEARRYDRLSGVENEVEGSGIKRDVSPRGVEL